MVISTPCAGSRPAITKQYSAPVRTPVPKLSGQATFAGSFRGCTGTGFGLRVAGRRPCAYTASGAAIRRATIPAVKIRMWSVYRRARSSVGAGAPGPLRDNHFHLEQIEQGPAACHQPLTLEQRL